MQTKPVKNEINAQIDDLVQKAEAAINPSLPNNEQLRQGNIALGYIEDAIKLCNNKLTSLPLNSIDRARYAGDIAYLEKMKKTIQEHQVGDINAGANAMISATKQAETAIAKARQSSTVSNWKRAMNLADQAVILTKAHISQIPSTNTNKQDEYKKMLIYLQEQAQKTKNEASAAGIGVNNTRKPLNVIDEGNESKHTGGYRRTHKRRHYKKKHTHKCRR
jgi:hypothetical protein